MENVKYSRVMTEMDEIVKYLDPEILGRIPKKLLNNIRLTKDNQYNFKLDKTKSLDEQQLLNETKQYLSAIFIIYCCDREEQTRLINICKKNDKKEAEKYDIGNVFKERQAKIINETNEEKIDNNNENNIQALQVIPKTPWYKKIINSIKKLFSRKDEKK